MTPPMTLQALAERAERASGPDRELDGFIHAHLTRGEKYIIGNEPGRFPQKPIYGERLDVMLQIGGEDGADYIGAPAFSASLDAAVTLVPEGYDWILGSTNGGLTIHAEVGGRGDEYLRFGATPALALVAASLRAHASQMKDER